PQPRILGFDAAGVVEAVGPEVTMFQPGDEVYYAGDVTRPGSNAQYQLVDERLVAAKPITLDFAEAAALPLTALTAWELLFERMPYRFDGDNAGRRLLVIAGAGGVGSMAIPPARRARITGAATASRPGGRDWCRRRPAPAGDRRRRWGRLHGHPAGTAGRLHRGGHRLAPGERGLVPAHGRARGDRPSPAAGPAAAGLGHGSGGGGGQLRRHRPLLG